jgi:hypothetical protein
MSNIEKIYTPARIDEAVVAENPFKDSDPFIKNWEDLKSLNGLDNNFKRRAARISKMTYSDGYLDSAHAVQSSTSGDSKSKALNPGTIYRNAYGLFDVITPPYNLYELASYYDTSFANHAAIDAKVENTVGLGYDFVVSDRTTLKLESSADQKR